MCLSHLDVLLKKLRWSASLFVAKFYQSSLLVSLFQLKILIMLKCMLFLLSIIDLLVNRYMNRECNMRTLSLHFYLFMFEKRVNKTFILWLYRKEINISNFFIKRKRFQLLIETSFSSSRNKHKDLSPILYSHFLTFEWWVPDFFRLTILSLTFVFSLGFFKEK